MTDRLPLTAQQETFLDWMHATGELRHPAPICATIRITDRFDPHLLRPALVALVGRHEALRMAFPAEHGHRRAVLRVAADLGEPEVRLITAEGADPDERLTHALALATAERERAFDLDRAPLLRALVIRLGEDDQILVLAAHHLVFDDWSMGVLLRELGIAYSALRAGRPIRLGRIPPVQFSEVVTGSREQWPANREAWQELLAGAPSGLTHLAGRQPTDTITPASVSFEIDEDLALGLRKTARTLNATTFMTLLAAWIGVLSDRSVERDIVVMSPVAGRTRPGSESTLGCLFTPLLIRVQVRSQPDFPELVNRVRRAAVRATTLQDYPYHEFRRVFGHAPCVGYYSWRVPLHFPGLASELVELPPLLVADTEEPGSNLGVPQLSILDRTTGSMPGRLIHNGDAFAESTVRQLAQDLLQRLREVC